MATYVRRTVRNKKYLTTFLN